MPFGIVLSSSGAKGATGATGATGPQGPAGPSYTLNATTGSFSATAANIYSWNGTSAVGTCTFPAAPSNGDQVILRVLNANTHALSVTSPDKGVEDPETAAVTAATGTLALPAIKVGTFGYIYNSTSGNWEVL